MIAKDGKWKNHTKHVANNANRMLGLLKRTFESRDPFFYRKLVRFIDKTTSGVCSPNLEPMSDWRSRETWINVKTVHKIREGFENLSYSETLSRHRSKIDD